MGRNEHSSYNSTCFGSGIFSNIAGKNGFVRFFMPHVTESKKKQKGCEREHILQSAPTRRCLQVGRVPFGYTTLYAQIPQMTLKIVFCVCDVELIGVFRPFLFDYKKVFSARNDLFRVTFLVALLLCFVIFVVFIGLYNGL